MTLYHGSRTGGIGVLKPNLADHDRPYVYMSTLEAVAAFYLCNAVERPYYWFPYGFEGDTLIYHELYPNALKEVSDGVSGYIYEVNADEVQVIPFKNIPCARLATEPIKTMGCIEVTNAYELFMKYIEEGRMKLGRFEDKSQKELERWYSLTESYIREKHLPADCSYTEFVREKFPRVWERIYG
ncbi:MAG: hypothetical protein K2O14_09225 [Oscillospiraceae bacterium]|nr:hypothetical protein [Oscillospiraceae bacterium]